MNKPSKSKAEYKSRNSHSTAIVTIIDETSKTFVLRYDDGSTLRCHKDHFERDWEQVSGYTTSFNANYDPLLDSTPDIITSMEADERRERNKDLEYESRVDYASWETDQPETEDV